MADRKKKHVHEVVFHTYPKLVFCWPLIAIGFLLWPLAAIDADPEILAWIWCCTLILVVLTIGVDINRNYAVFWTIVLIAFWLLVLWLDAIGIGFFKYIHKFFADMDPQYSGSLGLLVSIPLLIAYIIMWVWTRINCRWRITHNEFEHYQFGRMDDSIARGAKRLRSSYPDFFELLILMAGDLIIYDAVGKKELRRIQHVPLLPLVKKKLNRLLEMTAVTADVLEDEQNGEIETGEYNDSDDDRTRE